MAAEVSVSDVLCEAMDYLSKLGSNLKTRTDNLKEKRIRKDKLRNSRSVHKAANKVLLICELSKKSLENVEKGVRKILDKVIMTQTASSDGGNLGVNCNSETDMKFQQFYYGSRALRICKTVPVKHYMSAKVRVRNMSVSMQEKYPVYYDCKLYRIRRKKLKPKEQLQIGMENEKPEMPNAIQNKNSSTYEACCSNKVDFLSSHDDPSKDNTVEQEQVVDINTRPLVETFSSTQSVNASETSILVLIQENKDAENMLEVQTVQRLDKHMLEDNQTPLTNRESETCENLKNNYENIKNNTADESVSSDKELIKGTAKVRSKKHRVLDDSSDDNENVQNNDSKTKTSDEVSAGDEEVVSENNKIQINKTLNAIAPDNDEDSKTKQSLLDINEQPAIETNEISDDTKKSEELTTPHIKCVNIFKLLKPDIVNNIQSESEKKISIKHSRPKTYKSIKPYLRKPQTCSINELKENELVNAKRKEVLAFKPKKFIIKLHRLPSFSKALLHKYKLKRIMQNGSVLCEVDLVDTNMIKESDVEKYNLLNDSDTDDIAIKRLSTERKRVKYALLHDSDSDDVEINNINDNRFARSVDQENVDTEFQATSSKVLDVDISESHSRKPKKGMTETNRRETLDENGLTENIKRSLLDESDVDMPDIEENNLMTEQMLKSSNENFGNISDMLNATENSLELCNETYSTAQNIDKIKHTEASNLELIIDNNVLTLLANKEHEGINPIDLDKHKPDNNSCESLDNNDFLTKEKNSVDKSVKGTSIEVSNSQVCTDENMKSQNELQFTDLTKTLTDENEQLKDSLLRESDSDDQPTDNISMSKENNSETVKSKVLSIVDSNDHDVSKSTKGIEAPNNTENQIYSSVRHSGSGEKETNKLSNKNNDTSNLEKNGSNNSNITESITSDGKVDSNVIENETRKEISPNKIKSSLLNSSDESQSDNKKSLIEPKLRRKRIRESIKARKMLLTNSSSSDEDDVPSNGTLKNHKNIDKMIKEIVDEIETIKKITTSSSSGSSDEDLIKTLKKRRKHKLNRTKKRNKIDEDSTGSQSAVEENQNAGENSREESDSSSSQMVRSKSKPGSSVTHNSDTQDDKDVDRLTNLENLTNPHRRRGSTCSNNTEETVTTEKRKEMPKGPSLIGEELLNAESSSESNSEDENLINEDLPEVTLPSINNGIGHISKDDLLGDSDSSVSQNGKMEENTQEDSDEENVKSKRRKGNTISSDSEAGASRKKDRDVKLSDFEDSDDSEEPTKRTKRIKKATDSDASLSSSDANKKKRRRIKQINESDLSDSDGENEGRNKHGRKNIRKVMGKNQLEEATKKAAREEKERIARIAERQKLYNNLEFDESGKPDEVVLEKVVLDFDPETKEPLIEVDRGLVKKLKPHQANGIKFMWDACFESVKRIKKDKGSGCILAHCMGLGKTLQVISLTHTLLTHGALTGVSRVLVVCPLSTVLNWVNEFRMWLKHAETDFEVDVYELSKNKQNMERAAQLSQWYQDGGVCVLGYEMFRNLSADNNKKFKKKMLKSFQESLVDPGPDLVVCDEGHLLKNEKTSLSQSMNKVKTLRRIVLTGTPLQNNLKEYYCMVQFVKPNLLGKYNEYLNRFVNPITNGQYTDSTEQDIRVMKRRSHVLHKMLDGAVQRRDYGVLAPFLPPKHEFVLFITLSDVQIKLYQTYLDNYSRRPQPGKSSGFLFPDFQSLQRIWTHPLVLKYNSERYEIMQQKKREREEDDSEGSLVDFIDDDSTSEETSTEESTDVSSDMSDDSRKKSKKKKSSKKNKGKDKVSTRRGTRANPAMEQDEEDPVNADVVEVKYENPTEWWVKLVSDDELEDIRNSHKLVLLFDILRQCEAIGDKLLVFSQSLYSLDLIEHFLGKVDEATQEGRMDEKLGGHFGSWSPGVDYFRLDGSTSCENRSIWCKNFNREDNPRARLFLISTRAGGLGINLVAANRVVIFDVSWNPSHDVQSIFRVYRFGQKKPCYVYRFLAMGTMEEKIYERQVTKQAISKRVIDEQQIDRHYAENDLAELYKFEPKPSEPRELPPLPKDRLFAEMLREHEAQIYKYHEHDSLLENKEEETLTEEERKAAWEDFENEKNRPPPSPFPTWPTHNGMMPNLLAQQQQAYAMLAAMMGKDITKVNDAQLGDMLPLLYNSAQMFGGYDYGMMQKMNNYKYGQAGMMNPMMASVMNSAAGSGMGGTSGLQYEPPWQRQHQQQLRLQQLMQQQNSMGAKYYAGGLGSRDPVAMALQQQRAREFMLGGGGGAAGAGAGAGAGVLPAAAASAPGAGSRPRGRPPLRARTAAPTGPADVVNLDSD